MFQFLFLIGLTERHELFSLSQDLIAYEKVNYTFLSHDLGYHNITNML